MFPYFANKLEGLTPFDPSALDGMQVSIGDVLGVPLLPEEGAQSLKVSSVGSDTAAARLWDLVVLSNYMLDFDWLLKPTEAGRVLRPSTVGSMIVLSGLSDNRPIAASLRNHGWPTVTHGGLNLPAERSTGQVCIISPRLPVPYGTHHTKAAICVGSTFVRVAIFTANFVHGDWRRKNQGVYIQDFPLKGAAGPSGTNVHFEHDLTRYFMATGWRDCAALLGKFDFTSAVGHLVASVPGYHPLSYGSAASALGKEGACNHWGMWHLRHQLRNYLKSGVGDSLTWQFSSQGSLTADFLGALSQSMMTSATSGNSSNSKPNISVVFPTVTEVRRSVEGWDAGLSIPVPSKNLHDFVNRRYHRWSPRMGETGGWVHPDMGSAQTRFAMTTFGRHRYMPHIKSYCRFDNKSKEADWVMVTSANLSRAAWGDVQKKGAQLMVRSYELGVLFIGAPKAWTVHGIAKAKDDRGAALKEGLHRIGIRGGGCLYLPYDVTNPVPYDSTVAVREGKTFQDAPRDAPWAVDLPHVGHDIWGASYENVLADQPGYGEGTWEGPELKSLMEDEIVLSSTSPAKVMNSSFKSPKKQQVDETENSEPSTNSPPAKMRRAERAVASANAAAAALLTPTKDKAKLDRASTGDKRPRDIDIVDVDND